MRVESSSQLREFVTLCEQNSSSALRHSLEKVEFLNVDLTNQSLLEYFPPSRYFGSAKFIRLLRLYRCRVQPEAMRRLAHCLKISDSITTLNFSGNSLLDHEACARELGQILQSCKKLRELYIHRNALTSNALRHVVREGLCKNAEEPLLRLNLQNNRIGPEGARILVQASAGGGGGGSEENTMLPQMLILAANELGERGMVPIAQMLSSNTSSLQWLDLADNGIGNQGLATVCNALLKNQTLHTLMLGNNGISSVSALCDLLACNSALRSIDLASNELDSSCVRALESAVLQSTRTVIADLGLYNNRQVDVPVLSSFYTSLTRAIWARSVLVLRQPSEIKRLGRNAPVRRLPCELTRLVALCLHSTQTVTLLDFGFDEAF